MFPDVLYASTDPDLASTAAARRAVFGATSTTTAQDDYLSALIRAASRWAEGYVGYPLSVQTYQETVAGYGSRQLRLAHAPVRAVPRFFDSTDTGSADELATSEYSLDRAPGFIRRDFGFSWTAPVEHELEPRPIAGQEYRPWLVEYVAGYTREGIDTGSANWSTEKGTTSTGRTLPEDIEYAVALRAAAQHRSGEIVSGSDVTRERLGDLEVEYGGSSSAAATGGSSGGVVLSPAEALLEPWRRMV